MSKKLSLIGIIILHFGKWEVTKDCLDSLLKLKTKNYKYKVLVVDNSRNSNLKKVISSHPAVTKLITPEKNLGFAGGNNLGIEQCKEWMCDYILFLNNDTAVKPSFLDALITAFDQMPELGMAGPVIEHQVRGKTYFDYGGYIIWSKGQARHFNKTTYNSWEEPVIRDFVTGCCMLVPVNVLNTIGGFNESYFLYLEDVELCLRAKKYGYTTALIPESKISHKGSQSATVLTKILYSWRNSLKLSLAYVPGIKKYSAICFNLVFYPLLYLRWTAGDMRRQLKQKGFSAQPDYESSTS